MTRGDGMGGASGLQDEEPLPQALVRRARGTPDDIVIISVEHGAFTFRDMEILSRRWAGALRGLDVAPGEAVITLVPNGPEALAVWTGVAATRAIEVPINPAYRGDWIIHVFNNARPRVAIVAERYLAPILEVADALTSLQTIIIVDAKPSGEIYPFAIRAFSELSRESDLLEDPPRRDDVACVVYTSGTTGASKGAMLTWAQMHFAVSAPMVRAELLQNDVLYAPFGPYHFSGKSPFYGAVLRGTRIVTREGFSTSSFWSDVRAFGCTGARLIGAVPNFIYRQPERAGDGENPLRYVVMVPVLPEVDDFKRRFGVEVFTVYNMTELSMPLVSGDTEVTSRNHASCGRVREGVAVKVVDADGAALGPNKAGELCVKTDDPLHLTLGYLGLPEKTAEAMRGGWFHTGDMFRYDEDGNYYFVDRIKDYIRRRGENISSFEVESIVNSHPAVLESASVAVPSEWGEDEVKVALVLKPNASIDFVEFIEYLAKRMPRFAIPRFVEVLPSLPRTPTERIQKAVIRDAGVSATTWDREKAGLKL